MGRKRKKNTKQDIHRELRGFEIKLNSFGQIETTKSLEDINAFLNRHMKSKKNPEKEQDNESE